MSELSTAIGNIYNRLADSTSTPTFHPASADLFTDWNVQAGDVVTVKSGSESYQVPVYSMKMRWSGAPRVLVESTGNPEREPLPAIKRREYSANSTNYKEQKALKSGVAGINNTMQNAGLYVNDQGVWAFANDPTNGLGATFSVQAGKIGMVVEERDGVNVIKSASIITAINNDTHKSEITLSADQIYANGNVQLSGWMSGVNGYFSGTAVATQFEAFTLYAYTNLIIGTGGRITYHGSQLGLVSVKDSSGNTRQVLGI